MIRIQSKRDGFRRAGVAHSGNWTEYPGDAFTAEQIETLNGDPMLQVEVVSESPETGGNGEGYKSGQERKRCPPGKTDLSFRWAGQNPCPPSGVKIFMADP